MRTPNLRSSGPDARLLTLGTALVSRPCPNRIPFAEPVPLRNLPFVLDWLLRQRSRCGRAVLQTYISQAVRVCRHARDRDLDLSGITLIVGSEPMTPAKHSEMVASGATVFARYCCSELGHLATECMDAPEPGDFHLMSDMIGMVRLAAPDGSGESPFLFTSLFEQLPKVMINTSLGDCGEVEQRECSCPYGELGFTTHLRDIHSTQRVTCEGMTISAADLARITEDVIRPKYGGSTIDYQWVEREGAGGRSRLCMRVAPSVGKVDESALISDVLSELGRLGRGARLEAGVWRQAATLTLERTRPPANAAAKTLPFVRE
jgi:hypothetical protein